MQNSSAKLDWGPHLYSRALQAQRIEKQTGTLKKFVFLPLKTKIKNMWQVAEGEQNECNTFQGRIIRVRQILVSNSHFILSYKVRNKTNFSCRRAHVIGGFSISADVPSVTSASVRIQMIWTGSLLHVLCVFWQDRGCRGGGLRLKVDALYYFSSRLLLIFPPFW